MIEDNQQPSQNQDNNKITEQEWLKKEHGEVLAYCSRNSLGLSAIIQSRSAVLPPLVAVWLVDSKVNKQQFWVITGDVPLDHISSNHAKDARDAIRDFSLRWQLQSENILNGLAKNRVQPDLIETQRKFAAFLISRAHSLYDIFEKDELWLN